MAEVVAMEMMYEILNNLEDCLKPYKCADDGESKKADYFEEVFLIFTTCNRYFWFEILP